MRNWQRVRFLTSVLCFCFIATASAATQTRAQAPSQLALSDIRYEVRPILRKGDLKTIRITLRFMGERDGQTTVFLPNEYAAQTELWRQIGAPKVTGGTFAIPRPNQWVISHKPRARITVSYDLTSAFESEPDMASMMSKPFRPIIRPTWFSLVGSTTFARLNVDDQTPIRFRWRGVPRGWKVASDLDHKSLTSNGLTASTLIGGQDLEVMRLGENGTRIAMRGNFRNFTAAQIQEDFTKLSAAQRALWGDNEQHFFISLAPITDNSGSSFQLGTGLGSDAFGAWALETTKRAEVTWLFAHEHLHAWLPQQVGGLDMSKSPILSYWFSEGFTNFYTAKTLLRSNLWTPEEWVKHWNEVIGDYQTNPARLMPAVDTVDKFWSDRTIGELPYQRGALIALTIDQRIKHVTNYSKSLDDVMIRMREKARNGTKFAPDLLIETVKEVGGIDISSLINDVAINGKAIGLPHEAWGSCVRFEEALRPAFDVGFDRQRTATGGNIVMGVRLDGPAYRAGLRDGMKILRRTTGQLGDPSVALTYELEMASGKVEILSWLPAGSPINMQTLSLGGDLALGADRDKRTRCLTLLSGA